MLLTHDVHLHTLKGALLPQSLSSDDVCAAAQVVAVQCASPEGFAALEALTVQAGSKEVM